MTLPPRILGVDWGTRRVGVAITDPLGIMARPLETIAFETEADLVARLRAICDERDVARIVVGLPVNMDGSHGPAAKAARGFAERLAKGLALPVETHDERLTSADADSRLADTGMHWRDRKKRVDQVAAALILESWLEKRARGGPAEKS